MATRLLTDKQWRAKHGWGELQAENKRLKERIKELTQGSDKKVDSFPL